MKQASKAKAKRESSLSSPSLSLLAMLLSKSPLFRLQLDISFPNWVKQIPFSLERKRKNLTHSLYLFLPTVRTLNLTLKDLNWTVLHFFKMGHSRPLFLIFRLFNTVDSKQMVKINFAHDGIRTAYLWCRKQPLCQLSHNHCPTVCLLYFSSQFRTKFQMLRRRHAMKHFNTNSNTYF